MKGYKSLKRFLAIMLAMSFVISMLTGCSDEEGAGALSTLDVEDTSELLSNEDLLKQEKEPSAVESVTEVDNLTEVVEGMGNGLVLSAGQGQMDENPSRTITRSTTSIPQIFGTDMYGNILGDEFYFHRNMLSDIGKKAYDQIYIGMSQCHTSIDFSVAITPEDLQIIRDAVINDHPEIFWFQLEYRYYTNNQGLVTTLEETYNDLASDIGGHYADFYVQALAICRNAAQYSSKADQVKYVNDILCNMNTYDLNSNYNQTAYSAIVQCNTVCAGYARAFQYCMQLLGIPATVVYGYAGENHSWNLVQLDGEYYNMDVTWNDCYDNPTDYSYDYFNVTDAQISADHQRMSTSVNLPAANGTYYNYYNSFFNGNAYGSDFSNFEHIQSMNVVFLGNRVADVVNGNATCVNNTDPDLNVKIPEVSQSTGNQTTDTSEDFNWDLYYEDLDSAESYEGDYPAGIAEGVYSDSTGKYVYYDCEYEIFYYYDDAYGTYIGFDEYDVYTTFIWEDGTWYYM